MIDFDSAEDAIEVAIQIFDKRGGVTIGNTEIQASDIITELEEDTLLIKGMMQYTYTGNSESCEEHFEAAKLKAKIKIITEAVNEWWAKQ
jgi:hypothetical protein